VDLKTLHPVDSSQKDLNSQWTDFFPQGHFYSPYPDRNWMYQSQKTYENSLYPQLAGIELNLKGQKKFAGGFHQYFEKPNWQATPIGLRYGYKNGFFEGLSNTVPLLAMMGQFRPQRYVEVGSGWSTAALLDIRDTYGYRFKLDCVEPYPEKLLQLLSSSDMQTLTLHR